MCNTDRHNRQNQKQWLTFPLNKPAFATLELTDAFSFSCLIIQNIVSSLFQLKLNVYIQQSKQIYTSTSLPLLELHLSSWGTTGLQVARKLYQ